MESDSFHFQNILSIFSVTLREVFAFLILVYIHILFLNAP